MPRDDIIVEIYASVDDFVKQLGRLRKRGFPPKLSDAEVITMEIVGEILGIGSDKAIYDYFQKSLENLVSRDKHYYGFKGHLLINQEGLIIDFEVTPANGNEQEVLLDLAIPKNNCYCR